MNLLRSWFLILCISPALAGICTAAETITASVSILPRAYFVERLVQHRAAVHVMIPKGASPETYEPTPQQMAALADSQLYVKVGVPISPSNRSIFASFRDATGIF